MVEVGADRVWVADTGGDGPVVVLVHPGIHDATVWEPVLPLLEDFRVVRYDARGYGRSPFATEEFRAGDDLAAVLDARGLDRIHLVGNSMGGRTSLSFTLAQPERVRSLTVLAPGILGYPWADDDPALERAYAEALESGDRDAMIEVSRRIWCAAGTDDALLARLGAAYDADVAQEGLELDDPEQWSRVDTIDAPTAVVIGTIDVASMVTASTDLAAAVPGAELVRLEGVDHLPSLRAPQTVADVVRRTADRAG